MTPIEKCATSPERHLLSEEQGCKIHDEAEHYVSPHRSVIRKRYSASVQEQIELLLQVARLPAIRLAVS